MSNTFLSTVFVPINGYQSETSFARMSVKQALSCQVRHVHGQLWFASGKKGEFFMGEKKYKQVKNDYQKNKTKTGRNLRAKEQKKKRKNMKGYK